MSASFWLRVGAIWGFLAVSMGAFGAHVLRERFKTLGEIPGGLSTERLEATFERAAQYHMYCALVIVAIGVLAVQGRVGTLIHVSGWLFLVGSVIFSGSLYALSMTGISKLGAITPLGGVSMLAAWLVLAFAAQEAIRP